jgi:hypothetical protein
MEITLNNFYLIKEKLNGGNKLFASQMPTNNISLIEIVNITDTCYNLTYENKTSVWVEKEVFFEKYIIVENISKFIIKK